ncbi:MAG TPA: GNAT family N-acetyltransferase [Burkholderiales bacterium]|jgi:GNAT superfamily N-acetyltransferase|nr:GNAT family N-acetyltransferase [Burkholderiales bacterium]
MLREVLLRPATADDASAVAEVLLSSRKAFLPYACLRTDEDVRGWVRSVLVPTGGVTMAVAAGSPTGVLATARDAGAGWVTQLYVSPAHVDQGVGTLLLSHALSILPLPVRLWCFQRNVRARRFYERHGFNAIRFTDGRGNEERLPDVLYELAP